MNFKSRIDCRAGEQDFGNPNGILSFSPGLPSQRGYPGSAGHAVFNPERVGSFLVVAAATPLEISAKVILNEAGGGLI
ncbi:MAG: hypothetical protein IPK15_04305 [Verrucomicrobia bacterium]|nr:hypothetical protein [Verrucomicrobiota bacterium]